MFGMNGKTDSGRQTGENREGKTDRGRHIVEDMQGKSERNDAE